MSLSFQTRINNITGKPTIQWNDKSKDPKLVTRKSDKLSYIKTNKNLVNSKKQIKTNQKSEAVNYKLNSNGKPLKSSKPINNTSRKNDANISKSQNSYVTLTKNQLNTILETVGKLVDENSALQLTKDNKEEQISEVEDLLNQPINDTDTDLNGAENSLDQGIVFKNEEKNTGTTLSLKEKKQLKWNSEKAEASVYYPFSEKSKEGQNQGQPNNSAITSKPDTLKESNVSVKHLTKIEKKKLEWLKDRECDNNAWDPWGKQGSGAPLTDFSGNPLADYNKRKSQINNSPRKQVTPNNQLDHLTFNNSTNSPAAIKSSYTISNKNDNSVQIQNAVNDRLTVNNTHTIPAAIRSSFTIGQVAPNEDKYLSTVNQEKKQWLLELEKQREEAKQRKEKEKQQYLSAESKEPWAYTNNSSNSNQVNSNGPLTILAKNEKNNTIPAENRVFSAPQVTSNEMSEKSPELTYIYGQNIVVDDVTKKELEEKQKRHMEHQKAIQQQVEEKRRGRAAEREQKLREDLEMEKKLEEERIMLQRQYEQEQNTLKQKEQAERQRIETLKLAMDKAKEEAERQKQEKRLRRLQAGGHDVHNLQSTYDAKTPRNIVSCQENKIENLSISPSNIPSDLQLTGMSALETSETNVNDGNSYISSEEILNQINIAQNGSYQTNKILTPTKCRNKDLGTQTIETNLYTEDSKVELKSARSSNKNLTKGSTSAAKVTKKPEHQQRIPSSSKKSSKLSNHDSNKVQNEKFIKKPKQILKSSNRNAAPTKGSNSKISIHAKKSGTTIEKPINTGSIEHHSDRPVSLQDNLIVNHSENTEPQNQPAADNSVFVPFVRSNVTLDPSRAESPLVLSREQTIVQRGRQAYLQSIKPGTYGKQMTNHPNRNTSPNKERLFDHNSVADHPTNRQNRILMQLSDLRRNLLEKQREFEIAGASTPEIKNS